MGSYVVSTRKEQEQMLKYIGLCDMGNYFL